MRAVIDLILCIVALALIASGLWPMVTATQGLEVKHLQVGDTPATLFRPASGQAGPVVVIAHGFAGSRQLMHPFAITLARAGYTALTFDFLGHGRHPMPLTGSVTEEDGATAALLAQLGEVVDAARVLDGASQGVALLGHSMASDVLVRFVQQPGEVAAGIASVVTVSMFAPTITAQTPRNLLVIVGAWEQALVVEALRAAELVAGKPAEPGVTYGELADGTARKVVLAPNVEHVGVLYSPTSLVAARDWLDAVYGRDVGAGSMSVPEVRGPSIGMLFLGLLLLARPLAHRLPVVSSRAIGANLGWERLWLPLLLPMLLTPVLLRLVPISFLPIAVGDYLVTHFALYGLLTWGVLKWLRRRESSRNPVETRWPQLATGVVLLAAYNIVAFGVPIDRFITSFWPSASRLPLVLAMLVGTLPYFVADEWLTRGKEGGTGAYAASKVAFLVSLGIAVALDLERLFFLIIIVPVILVFFVVYGAFAGWAYGRTAHPLTGGLANAIAFAWAIAVTFPMVTG